MHVIGSDELNTFCTNVSLSALTMDHFQQFLNVSNVSSFTSCFRTNVPPLCLYNSDLNRKVIGAGDFNENGRTDLVWEHQPTGGVYVWLMNGVTYSNGAWLLSYSSDLDWEIEAP